MTTEAQLEWWLRRIVSSYRYHTGKDLPNIVSHDECSANWGDEQAYVLLAHDRSLDETGALDPRFVYANRAASHLWEMTREELLGMPSRLSAEAQEQGSRQKLLTSGEDTGLISNYEGVRISKQGRRFLITGVELFNLYEIADSGDCLPERLLGQAAYFSQWRFL